jgi:hypothetical protein
MTSSFSELGVGDWVWETKFKRPKGDNGWMAMKDIVDCYSNTRKAMTKEWLKIWNARLTLRNRVPHDVQYNRQDLRIIFDKLVGTVVCGR